MAVFGPIYCPVYLLETRIKFVTSNCFSQLEPCVIFTMKSVLPSARKDLLLAINQSNIGKQYT